MELALVFTVIFFALAFTYTNEIMLEFLAGIWLAALWPKLRLSKPASVGVLVVGAFWLTSGAFLSS